MSTDIVFYPHAISSDLYQGSNLFQLTNIFDVAPSHNHRDLVEFAASQVGPQFTGTHLASPDIRFSTHQLTTLLSVTTAGDYYIARNLGGYVTDLHYKAGKNLGMRYADNASQHFRMRADRNSMLVVESISCEEGQLAVARCRLCCVYNPEVGTDPLVPTAGVTLTATSTTGILHTLGPIKLNGSWLKGLNSWSIDFNVEYDEESSSGEGFLTYCSVKRYRPVLSMRTRKTDYMATYGSRGTALSSLYAFLRNKLESGINEADASAYHILGSNSGYGTIKARGVQGDNSLCEISVDLNQSSQNVAALALAVNQAIA